jgi:hypothetical protein
MLCCVLRWYALAALLLSHLDAIAVKYECSYCSRMKASEATAAY